MLRRRWTRSADASACRPAPSGPRCVRTSRIRNPDRVSWSARPSVATMPAMPHTVVQLSKRLATELLKDGAFRHSHGTAPARRGNEWARSGKSLLCRGARTRKLPAIVACCTRDGWKPVSRRDAAYSRNSTVGPVIRCPEVVTQSVRNVWLPLSALHHRVGCVYFSPGDSVSDSVGALTWEPLKKLTRWLNTTDVDPLFSRICAHAHRLGVSDSQPSTGRLVRDTG